MDGSIGRRLEDAFTALAAVAVAAIVTALFWPLPAASPLVPFLIAVGVAAWRGGAMVGLAATLGSALLGAYFFLPPYFSLRAASKSASPIFVFLCAASLIVWLFAALRNPWERERRPWVDEFVENNPEGVAIIDAQGRITRLNAAAERLTGWARREARGKPSAVVFQLVDERTRERRDPVAEALAAGEGARPDGRAILVPKNGPEIFVSTTLTPIRKASGVVAEVVMVVRGDSARKLAEEGLRQTGELNRKIIDNSDVCIKLLDLNGRVLTINKHGARLLEMDAPEEWLGRELAENWPEGARRSLRDAARRAARGEWARFEAFAPTVKGTPKWWDITLTPILDANGQPEKLLCVGRDVTRRKRNEDALRAGEERYRALFDSIDVGFCIAEVIFDDQGNPFDLRVLETNPASERLTGPGGTAGRTLREAAPDRVEPWLDLLGRIAQTGESARFANLAPALNGRFFDVHAFRLGGDESRKVAILFANVTETALAERERGRLVSNLENERAQMARVIEKSPAFIAILRGPEHVFELANAEYRKTVGRRDLIGRPIAEAVPELKAQGAIGRLDRVYQTGEEFVGRERTFWIDQAGTNEQAKRVANLVVQALREPNGSITGVFIHGVDVTDAIEAAEAIRDSEARFRQLANAMPQGAWTADAEGRIEFRNDRWREYTGFHEEFVPIDAWMTRVHPDDIEKLKTAWNKASTAGEPFEAEFRFKRASDGALRWLLSRALPIRDEKNRIVRWIGTNTDIDDFKRLSEALRESDRRKDEFLATLAHELRNPLAPIRTGLDLLGMGLNPDVFASTLEMMSRQLGHVIHLIDDLMDVARVNSGKVSLRRERVTLRSTVAAALESSRPLIKSKRHELTVALAKEPIWLEADPTRLSQVVSNLLTNAAKYTRPGGRITVSTERRGGEGVIRVKDTGDGIAPEKLPGIFEIFNQIDLSNAHSEGGLGIGLTVVKRLVELHGGRIEARSEGLGRGSEFIVRLPLTGGGEAVESTDFQGSPPTVEIGGVGGNG